MNQIVVNIKYPFLYFILLLSGSCKSVQDQKLPFNTNTPTQGMNMYFTEIKEWQEKRNTSLGRANGWTTLTGLFWLKEGKQSFGSDEDQDLLFPENMPGQMGVFTLSGEKLECSLNPALGITINDEITSQTEVNTDAEGKPSIFNWKSHFWHPIKRGDKIGIRLRDTLHPSRFAMHKIPCYPIDTNWRIRAKVLPPEADQTINIDNIVGISSDNPVAGILEFEKDGLKHQITALDAGPDRFFLIIADETSGDETYGGGRYLVVDRPGEGNETYIDFNKTYNPPCAFTDYATCPLPPKENYLKLAITAGEKTFSIENH